MEDDDVLAEVAGEVLLLLAEGEEYAPVTIAAYPADHHEAAEAPVNICQTEASSSTTDGVAQSSCQISG